MSSNRKNSKPIPLSGTLADARDPPNRQESTSAIAAVPEQSSKAGSEVLKTKPKSPSNRKKPSVGNSEAGDGNSASAGSSSKATKKKRKKPSDQTGVDTTSANSNSADISSQQQGEEPGEVIDEGDGEGKNESSDEQNFQGDDSEDDYFNPRYNSSSKMPNDDSDEDTLAVRDLKAQNRTLEAELAQLRAAQTNRSYKANNVNITTNLAPERLQGLNYRAIEKWETSLKTLGGNGVSVEKALYLISDLDVTSITRDINAFVTDKGERQAWLKADDREGWKTWPIGKLIQRLKRVYPEHASSVSAASALARVQRVNLTFHSRNNFDSVVKYMRTIDQILMTFDEDSLKSINPSL
jgi:hypothetical protein